jgi:uncharacterized membrane protein
MTAISSFFILYFISAIVGMVILYYVIKAAVKAAIIETRSTEYISKTQYFPTTQEKPANAEQIRLQQRYDKGEITFEFYQAEWNRLNTL